MQAGMADRHRYCARERESSRKEVMHIRPWLGLAWEEENRQVGHAGERPARVGLACLAWSAWFGSSQDGLLGLNLCC